MTIYQIRFYHSGDYDNNQSEDYLHNGALHGEYATLADARAELDRIGAYNYDHGNWGKYEFDSSDKVVGWTYSSPTLAWGMRYWITTNQDTIDYAEYTQALLSTRDFFSLYKRSETFRLIVAATGEYVGLSASLGKAYAWRISGIKTIIRHNADGTFTHIL